MYAAFVQSSFKFNMLQYTKPQLMRLYSVKRDIKSENYYDTLKISPYATQNEVKSAYYKLTLQYHPDKNKTEYARQKFHDISEAYEVLSNHEQRKIYDRRMLMRRQPTMSTASEQPTSHYKDKVYSGSSKIYNFDAWTQAHYGQQLRERHVRRKAYEATITMEKINIHKKEKFSYMEFAVFLFTITLMALYFQEKPDVPAKERRKKESQNIEN